MQLGLPGRSEGLQKRKRKAGKVQTKGFERNSIYSAVCIKNFPVGGNEQKTAGC